MRKIVVFKEDVYGVTDRVNDSAHLEYTCEIAGILGFPQLYPYQQIGNLLMKMDPEDLRTWYPVAFSDTDQGNQILLDDFKHSAFHYDFIDREGPDIIAITERYMQRYPELCTDLEFTFAQIIFVPDEIGAYYLYRKLVYTPRYRYEIVVSGSKGHPIIYTV